MSRQNGDQQRSAVSHLITLCGLETDDVSGQSNFSATSEAQQFEVDSVSMGDTT